MECEYDCEKIKSTFLFNEYDVSYDEHYSHEKDFCYYGINNNHKDLFSMILQQQYNNDINTDYNKIYLQ